MAATRPSQCGASRHTFVPGAKYLEPRTGFFVSPTTLSSTTRAVRYQIHLGVRGTQQAPAQARDRSPLCSHHPTPASSVHQRACRTSRSRLQRERSHTHIEEAEASEGVHDLIRRLGSLNSGAEPRRKYTATSHGRTNSPRQAVYSQDCPVHVQASCSAPHPKKGWPFRAQSVRAANGWRDMCAPALA